MKAKQPFVTVVLGITRLILLTGCRNLSPVASFTCNPSSGQCPLTVSFDASASSDPDGSIVSYEWSFGDGGSDTGVTASHTYQTAGTYTTMLKVTDNEGATDSTSLTIQVNEPPCSQCIEIVEWQFGRNHRGAPCVTGVARNDCPYALKYVELFAYFYDADNIEIGSYWHFMSGVAPHEEWSFEIECPISAVWPEVTHASIELHSCTPASR